MAESQSPRVKAIARTITAIIVLIIAIVIFVSCISGGSDDTAEAPAASESTEPTAEAAAVDADEVMQTWMANYGVEDPIELLSLEGYEGSADNPTYAITEWRNVNSTDIEVTVQESLTDDSARNIGTNIIHLTFDAIPDLDTVWVVDATDGREYWVSRSSTPMGQREG